MGSLRGGEKKKMERKRAEEEKVGQMKSLRKAIVASLRGQMRRAEGTWRTREGSGGLGSSSKSQTEQTVEGARG